MGASGELRTCLDRVFMRTIESTFRGEAVRKVVWSTAKPFEDDKGQIWLARGPCSGAVESRVRGLTERIYGFFPILGTSSACFISSSTFGRGSEFARSLKREMAQHHHKSVVGVTQ